MNLFKENNFIVSTILSQIQHKLYLSYDIFIIL